MSERRTEGTARPRRQRFTANLARRFEDAAVGARYRDVGLRPRGEAVFERMSVLLEDTAARYPELLAGVRLGFAGGLDPEVIEKRAFKIFGDRERCVRDALGEMVTYLEFELRSHPRIEDPEIYLDAIEELRAKIDL